MLLALSEPLTNLSNNSSTNINDTIEIDSNKISPIIAAAFTDQNENANDAKTVSLESLKQCVKPNAIVRPVVRKTEANATMTLPQAIEPNVTPTKDVPAKQKKRQTVRSTPAIDTKSKSIAKDSPSKTMPKNVTQGMIA